MGSKTVNTTVNKPPEFVAQPKNPYYEQAAKDLENVDYITPVMQAFGNQDNLIRESGNELFGANTSPEVASKVRSSRLFKSATDKGTALSQAKAQEEQEKFARRMSLGGATAPVMFSPGGTQTGNHPFSFGELYTQAAVAAAGGASAAA